jgi:hypothetical protein
LDKRKRLLFMRANPKLALFKRKAAFHWIEEEAAFYERQSKAGSLQKERSTWIERCRFL